MPPHIDPEPESAASPPSHPQGVASVDERIAAENRQIRAAMLNTQQQHWSIGKRLLYFMSLHKVASGALLGSILVMMTVGTVLLQNRSNGSGGAPAVPPVGGEAELEPIDTESYEVDLPGQEAVTGGATNSGSGLDASDNVTKPVTPTGLKLEAGATQLTARWQPVRQATQYRLEFADNAKMEQARLVTAGGQSAVLPGLQPDTRYYVRVQAVNGNGTSGWSSMVAITTRSEQSVANVARAGRVGGLRVKVNSTQSITLSWNGAAHARYYTVIRAGNSAMNNARKEYAATASKQYTVSDLRPGTTYYFTVTASNQAGYGPASAVVNGKTRPLAPQIREVSLLSSSNQIRVSFVPSTGATGYTLRYAASSSFAGARTVAVSASARTVTLSGLQPATTYFVQLRARDGSYSTAWSRTGSMHTTVAIPTGVKMADRTSTKLRVSWPRVAGAEKYQIRYAQNSQLRNSSSKTATSTNLWIDRLKADTTYYVQVRAYDGVRWTAWSKTRSMKTAVAPRQSFTITASFQNLGRERVSPVNVFRKIKNALSGRTNVTYNFAEIDASDPFDEHGALKQVFGTKGWSWFSTDQPQLARFSNDWKAGGTDIVKLLDGGQVFRSHGCPTGSEHLMISKYVNKSNSRTKFAVINTHFITHAYQRSDNNSWCRGHWDRSWQKLKDKVAALSSRGFDIIITGDFNHSSSNFPFLHGRTKFVYKSGPDVIFAIPTKGRSVSVNGKGAITTPTGESFHKNIWARLKFSGQ